MIQHPLGGDFRVSLRVKKGPAEPASAVDPSDWRAEANPELIVDKENVCLPIVQNQTSN
jgi:hypothetical protein